MTWDVSKQIRSIHAMADGRHMQWGKRLCVVLCVVMLVLGLYTSQPQYFMYMVLFVLGVFVSHEIEPHVLAASQAIRKGSQSEGIVEIEIERTSDDHKFYVTVIDEQSRGWQYQFRPLGWKPVAGQMRAKLYTLPDVDWPALIEVEGGVIHPHNKPTEASRCAQTAS
jgi:hypothetical protein